MASSLSDSYASDAIGPPGGSDFADQEQVVPNSTKLVYQVSLKGAD